MTKPVRVLWVDDSPDLLRVYSKLVQRTPDMEMAGTLTSADDLAAESSRLKPDVIVLDLTMPGKNPLRALAELTALDPDARTIVFSGYDDEATVREAMQAGAWGLVSKMVDGSPGDVLGAIRRVSEGESCFPGWASGGGDPPVVETPRRPGGTLRPDGRP